MRNIRLLRPVKVNGVTVRTAGEAAREYRKALKLIRPVEIPYENTERVYEARDALKTIGVEESEIQRIESGVLDG